MSTLWHFFIEIIPSKLYHCHHIIPASALCSDAPWNLCHVFIELWYHPLSFLVSFSHSYTHSFSLPVLWGWVCCSFRCLSVQALERGSLFVAAMSKQEQLTGWQDDRQAEWQSSASSDLAYIKWVKMSLLGTWFSYSTCGCTDNTDYKAPASLPLTRAQSKEGNFGFFS